MEKKLENLQILVNHLTYHYPDGTIALKGINLNIYSGEIVGIMGKNGAGKSTLIKTFNGLLKPTTGTVYIENDEVNNVLMSKLTRKVGIVFQNPDLQLFANTVEDEIKFSLKNLNFSKTELENQIYLTLEKFKLKKFQNRTPFTLSGGEKKRLAIASIMCRSEVGSSKIIISGCNASIEAIATLCCSPPLISNGAFFLRCSISVILIHSLILESISSQGIPIFSGPNAISRSTFIAIN